MRCDLTKIQLVFAPDGRPGLRPAEQLLIARAISDGQGIYLSEAVRAFLAEAWPHAVQHVTVPFWCTTFGV